jgi:hypothetical protein
MRVSDKPDPLAAMRATDAYDAVLCTLITSSFIVM